MSASPLKTLMNITTAALNPEKRRVMLVKLGRRLSGGQGTLSPAENRTWLEAKACDVDTLLAAFPGEIIAETAQAVLDINLHAKQVLSSIPHDLGGGGAVPLLYALVRQRQPRIVVETGVAAGFSSASFLMALRRNGQGRLLSSDFPYFRLENPEQYIGAVVPKALKDGWSLHLKGDEENLPAILRLIDGPIDLFHYDSDKSYAGRQRAMDLIVPHMAENGIIVMDDIQDNSFFHDYVAAHKDTPWQILRFDGKYVGVLGAL